MSTIQIRTNQVSSDDAYDDVARVTESGTMDAYAGEISESSAVTIASWWQSSGNIGSVLASFASGAEVDRDELLDDIYKTRRNEGYYTRGMTPRDRDALDCLSTFIINYGQE